MDCQSQGQSSRFHTSSVYFQLKCNPARDSEGQRCSARESETEKEIETQTEPQVNVQAEIDTGIEMNTDTQTQIQTDTQLKTEDVSNGVDQSNQIDLKEENEVSAKDSDGDGDGATDAVESNQATVTTESTNNDKQPDQNQNQNQSSPTEPGPDVPGITNSNPDMTDGAPHINQTPTTSVSIMESGKPVTTIVARVPSTSVSSEAAPVTKHEAASPAPRWETPTNIHINIDIIIILTSTSTSALFSSTSHQCHTYKSHSHQVDEWYGVEKCGGAWANCVR